MGNGSTLRSPLKEKRSASASVSVGTFVRSDGGSCISCPPTTASGACDEHVKSPSAERRGSHKSFLFFSRPPFKQACTDGPVPAERVDPQERGAMWRKHWRGHPYCAAPYSADEPKAKTCLTLGFTP